MNQPIDYRRINREVMTDTVFQCENNEALKQKIGSSIARQFMVAHEDNIDQPLSDPAERDIEVCGLRSFEAAKPYASQGKKTAVLNFANSHAVGGAPFAAGAQEESLCRCSTLYPCLNAMKGPFYLRHCRLFDERQINFMGNDDLIYTPDVCVFKTDERTHPIIPKMMPQSEWYDVDVITCAAPELMKAHHIPANYEEQIASRIKKILDVAKQQGVEVLVLGAWGCGAFRNPSDVVARVFHTQLRRYDFEKVIFALGRADSTDTAFFREFGGGEK